MFRRLTIVGLGLIGGSLGLAIRERKLAKEIVGVSRRRTTIQRARALGIVDRATLDLKKGMQDSDFIILCAPVLKIIDILPKIAAYSKGGITITDVGSTKSEIVRTAESVFPCSVKFVGSHPLAGSEKSGISFADKDIFKGAYCILTKTEQTDQAALNKVERFWRALGMKVVIMSPEIHDREISRLSHLPHILAMALVNIAGKKNLHLAAGGFRDTTRIASANPELWKGIFLTNRKNMIGDIKVLKKKLSSIQAALSNNSGREIMRFLRKAKDIRDSI